MKEDKAKGVKVVAPGGGLLAIGRIEASFVCRAGVGAVSVACANRRTLACEGGVWPLAGKYLTPYRILLKTFQCCSVNARGKNNGHRRTRTITDEQSVRVSLWMSVAYIIREQRNSINMKRGGCHLAFSPCCGS